jgi:hypothetical protein
MYPVSLSPLSVAFFQLRDLRNSPGVPPALKFCIQERVD